VVFDTKKQSVADGYKVAFIPKKKFVIDAKEGNLLAINIQEENLIIFC
jgi:hypothetical protein